MFRTENFGNDHRNVPREFDSGQTPWAEILGEHRGRQNASHKNTTQESIYNTLRTDPSKSDLQFPTGQRTICRTYIIGKNGRQALKFTGIGT